MLHTSLIRGSVYFGSSDAVCDRSIVDISETSSFSVNAIDTGPGGLFIKPDGTRVYFTGNQVDKVYQLDLSTAWDITSASSAGLLDTSSKTAAPYGLFFSDDGTKMFVYSQDDLHQYALSTAWDITSGSFTKTKNLGLSLNPIRCFIHFRSDGEKILLCNAVDTKIYEYNLSTAWDVATLSLVQSSTALSSLVSQSNPRGLHVEASGLSLFVVGASPDTFYKFTMSTAWDVSTLSTSESESTGWGTSAAAAGMFFRADCGSDVYVIDQDDREIHQFGLA